MKKLKSVCLLSALALLCTAHVGAVKIIGSVLTTDIKAYINDTEIPSYNVDGNMVIIVSDLRSYGFNVVYDDSTRTSYVSYDGSGTWDPITPSAESSQSIGEKVMDVYESDISVCVNGNYVSGYNVDGNMAIRLSELHPYGYYHYANANRASYLRLYETDTVAETLP